MHEIYHLKSNIKCLEYVIKNEKTYPHMYVLTPKIKFLLSIFLGAVQNEYFFLSLFLSKNGILLL